MKWAIVDTETTGGKASPDRITEIGIVLMDGCVRVGEFHSLVNPERNIPYFIQNLTGITPAMVKNAPVFADIAKEIAGHLQDRIFVAHNAAFDYGFVRTELEMCGIPFSGPRLCTVKMSRSVFPGHDSYSLSKFAPAMGIADWGAHRALGDAGAAASLLQLALERVGEEGVVPHIKGYAAPSVLPAGWTRERLSVIPPLPGILRVLGKQGQILYVTEANHLLEKATELLSNPAKRGSLAKVKSSIVDLDFTITGSPLLAKILAFQEQLIQKPALNRAVRIPSGFGPDMRDQVIIEAGRSLSERTALVLRRGTLLGFAYYEEDESLSQQELEDRMERLDVGGNLAPLLRGTR
jgi:DNA polymerase-3 subunit epsilon